MIRGRSVQQVCRDVVAKLLVEVSLDGGDLFLLSGFEAKGCAMSWKAGLFIYSERVVWSCVS